jgi:predicted nucleic acid binding AN1-type Zn finger protein
LESIADWILQPIKNVSEELLIVKIEWKTKEERMQDVPAFLSSSIVNPKVQPIKKEQKRGSDSTPFDSAGKKKKRGGKNEKPYLSWSEW